MSKIQDHSDRERPIGSDGLTDKERAVLALTDPGLDRQAIADRTNLKPHRVASIQANYADSGYDAWKESARNGSVLLARAINRMRTRPMLTGAAR